METRKLTYCINGHITSFEIVVDPKVDRHYKLKNRENLPITGYLNDFNQSNFLKEIFYHIWEHYSGDDQARVAINLVQNIPYDEKKRDIDLKYDKFVNIRYPYEVIFDNKGICSEKSLLLALLLKGLEYNVALFRIELSNLEHHMAVGIKVPKEFDYMGTGYAFIETTSVVIPTDECPVKDIKRIFNVISVAEGRSFASIFKEFNDVRKIKELKRNNMNNFEIIRIEKNYGIFK